MGSLRPLITAYFFLVRVSPLLSFYLVFCKTTTVYHKYRSMMQAVTELARQYEKMKGGYATADATVSLLSKIYLTVKFFFPKFLYTKITWNANMATFFLFDYFQIFSVTLYLMISIIFGI